MDPMTSTAVPEPLSKRPREGPLDSATTLKHGKAPWEAQRLGHTAGWVGVRPPAAGPFGWARRGAARGWAASDWLKAYRLGLAEAPSKDRRPDIARWMHPDEAYELLHKLESDFIRRSKGRPVPSTQDGHERALGGRLTAIASQRGAPEILTQPYRPLDKELFPLVQKGLLGAEAVERARPIIESYIEDAVVEEWNFDQWGWPTAIVPIFLVDQSSKIRLVADFRYPNGAVGCGLLTLPSPSEIAQRSRQRPIGKIDLRSGFHQVELAIDHRNAACFIFDGRLFVYRVMTFGWRSAPSAFQRRTTLTAKIASEKMNCQMTIDTYLDDFISSHSAGAKGDDCADAEVEHAALCSIIEELGWEISQPKLKKPSFTQDVLGLDLDTRAETIKVGHTKSQKIWDLLKACRDGGVDSVLDLARTLGKLVATMPAVRNILLLSRPLFAFLKDEVTVMCSDETLPVMRRGKDAGRYAVYNRRLSRPFSSEEVECVTYIIENWDAMNGRPFSPPPTTLLLRGDASADGTGCVVERVQSNGEVEQVAVLLDTLTPLEAVKSSLFRETLVICRAILKLDAKTLRNAALAYYCDNKGLADVFYVGSGGAAEPTDLLIAAVKRLNQCEATWDRTIWLPRAQMSREDQLSRERMVNATRLQVDQAWFDLWLLGLPAADRPTIDGLAEKANHKLSRYAALDGSGVFRDGARTPWGDNEVLYFFPPTSLPLIRRVWSNWNQSASRLAYFLVAKPLIDTILDFTHGTILPVEPLVKVPQYAANKGWTFSMIRCEKRREPKAESAP
jgi:hypothetical protein